MTTIPVRRDVTSIARRGRWAVALLTLLAAGCPTGTPQAPGPTTDGNEPNDGFGVASKVAFSADRRATLRGSVPRGSVFDDADVDVFDVGPLSAGDRVVFDASTPESSLDVAVAVFDADGRLAFTNDDRGGGDARFYDSYGDFVVRHEGDPYYLVVSRSGVAAATQRTGDYAVNVRITAGADVPAPAAQILFLNFEGGTIDAPSLPRTRVRPFDAGLIDDIYEGETERLKGLILASMIENYARFNVTIFTSDAAPPAAGVKFTTIHVGCTDTDAFGISESVDVYNADRCDDAIIFAEVFTPQMFSRDPSVEEMGLAIGNVTAHEAGHLLGLNHVDDDTDLMDTVSPADAFLQDQDFKESVLSDTIMPIGTQDAVLLLSETVGLKGS